MKSLIRAAAVAALLSVPVVAFAQAQADGSVSRAQVKSELAQLEQAGYTPNSDEPNYPAGLQAAEARVQKPSDDSNNSGYGGTVSHSSQSGVRIARPGDRNSLYFGD
jgi:hypothetical protein